MLIDNVIQEKITCKKDYNAKSNNEMTLMWILL